jgi:PAP2 superfamily
MSTNAHRARTVGARMVFARTVQRAGARREIVDCSRRADRAKSLGGNRIACLAALSALVVLAAPASAQANTVTNWNRIAVETLVALAPASGGAPPASQINMAMTQGAVYDAVNAIDRRHRPYLLERRFGSRASKRAAVATAAFRVLHNVVSTAPAFPAQAGLLQALLTEYTNSLAAIPDTPRKTKGIEAGNAAADAMLTARANDGRFGPSPWVPNPDPGHWQPLLNPDGTQMLDPTPWVGDVTPFLMTSSSQFRTDGPNALTSAAYAKDFNEVKALGSLNSTTRTPRQTHIAIFWQSTPVATWNAVARNLAERSKHNLDIGRSALLWAKLNLAAADAAINCWNDKYYWDFWRPWNAIPRADEDGNPATAADASWTPLLTAPYPDHPSGHLCLDGAYLRVLRVFFGTDEIRFGVTSVRFPGETRYFERFSGALRQITNARVWAGLHFRTADVQGRVLGKNVANYMSKHYFQPLD